METRVRNIVVGVFVVVVGLAALFFSLWVQGDARFQNRRQISIRFEGAAPGLRNGAAVTFNGLTVGQVTSVTFDRRDPNAVNAIASVDSRVPLSESTQVSLESQGLMGSIYVSLQGGSPDQPLVVKPGETMPQLVSGGATSLTQDAQQSLRMLQSVVSDNAGPLRDTIANLKAFTNVLAANSGRVDHILEGLEHLAGGSDKPAAPPTFDLIVPPLDNLRLDLPEAQLVVNDPTSVVSLDTQRFLKTTSAGEVVLQTAQWTDVIPKLVQKKLVDAFSKAKYRFASPPTDNLTPDYTMMIDVRRFAVAEGPSMTANVEFGLRLMGKDNKVVDSHVATGTAPATDADGGAAAAAMTKAFEAAARDTMTWYAKAAATPQQ